MDATPNGLVLYTVGHSNHALEKLLELLRLHEIRLVVDVRSAPVSSYTPHFNSANLKTALPRAGVEYLFLGQELGGRPEDERFYDAEGRVLYACLAEAPFFRAGLIRLQELAQKGRTAVLCSEEDPSECHRHLLIARLLKEQGVTVRHIRADGSAPSEEELARAAERAKPDQGQGLLFEVEAEEAWKSTRSVLPKGKPPISSLH